MLNLKKHLKDCTAQELVAALMLQASRDAFDPAQILQDLAENSQLWKSFWMGPLLPLDEEGSSPLMLLFLRDLSQFWNADTLYILAEDEDAANALQTVGFRWHCDTIRVVSRNQANALLGEFGTACFIVVCWWD